MKWLMAMSCIVFVLQNKLGCITASEGVDVILERDPFIPIRLDSDFEVENMEHGSNQDGRAVFPLLCSRKSRYRRFDGSCNNYKHPEWGTPGESYGRVLNNSYCDGRHTLPCSKSKKSLASPREISLKIFPDIDEVDPLWTVLTLQWGQVIAHDMSFAAGLGNAPTCCSNGQYTNAEKTDPRCASIPIPKDDPFNGPEGNKCYDFYRTESTNTKKSNEPKTSVTSFMDLSVVYGSSAQQAKDLRSFKGGRMISEMRSNQEWLPQNRNVKSACFNVSSEKEPCYRAGDRRVNQNPLLSVLQNILLREHNRIADYLCQCDNPYYQWNDERCFQEARKILIAMTQHINYYEFLPILIGQEFMVTNKLIYPDADDYVNDYDPSANPAILTEVATGVFRNLHTTIVGNMRFYLENRETDGSIYLSDYMNKPSIIENGDHFNQLTRCLTTQHQEAVDRYYTEETTQKLFKMGKKYGQDLRSLDIQRSRDHGVGTYVEALRYCNLSNPESFKDLEKYIQTSLVSLLQEVYEYVEDVELVVGVALEKLLPGTLGGPTFQCFMAKQFLRTRIGDKYFYENKNNTGAFNPVQLKSIREGSTIASLICNNVEGVDQMQPQAFLKISESNALVSCCDLPQVDLSLWK